ncbi:MAG: hypothetical protein Q4D17_10395, partial [Planctomycetia bacterium]|nr:hypothetical protein [Planctomycetia bacterium]
PRIFENAELPVLTEIQNTLFFLAQAVREMSSISLKSGLIFWRIIELLIQNMTFANREVRARMKPIAVSNGISLRRFFRDI